MYSRERTFRYMSLLFLLLFQLIFIPVSQAEQVVVTSGRVVYAYGVNRKTMSHFLGFLRPSDSAFFSFKKDIFIQIYTNFVA